ncbi:class I SAM-dependent methyltransferase [Planctomyces sp. SH-PL62]|uniref:class I SAM-dependent methyltransferase n=1 Tax=Planctomyces sp. SH-PL62 TaxID=1636152 RepID=UPI00078E196C|nr:class I SAM-dependent methyltransferase [Planctomyces sp. SH-PL62]AMV39355.1 putative methyltransferase YcgJ [Planctomyces sp. SH-PL62]
MIRPHDEDLAGAFDDQAPKFERAPVQSDPAALERLVRAAGFPAGALLLDAGCGPGLVSEAFLKAGDRVFGVDLSPVMIDRARARCGFAGDSARFLQGSIYEDGVAAEGPFDGAYSRYVLHHVLDPRAFLARQIELVRPGGLIVLGDHITSPDPALARRHQEFEVGRDRTHTRNLTGGELVDLFADAGLNDVHYQEEAFALDFDEWFDRGSPSESKQSLREALETGLDARGFRVAPGQGATIRIECVYAIVRGRRD